MNAIFDFKRRADAEDCHTMFTAWAWSHSLSDNRVTTVYKPESFGQMAGEAAVFAPVQITVE